MFRKISLLSAILFFANVFGGCKKENHDSSEVQQGPTTSAIRKTCKTVYLGLAPLESKHDYISYITKYYVITTSKDQTVGSVEVDLGPGTGKDKWFENVTTLKPAGEATYASGQLRFFFSEGEPYLLHGNHLAKLEGCDLDKGSRLHKKFLPIANGLLSNHKASLDSKDFVLVGRRGTVTLENAASKCVLNKQNGQPIKVRVNKLTHKLVNGYKTSAVIMTGVVRGKGLPPECSAFANKELTFSGANWYASLEWDN